MAKLVYRRPAVHLAELGEYVDALANSVGAVPGYVADAAGAAHHAVAAVLIANVPVATRDAAKAAAREASLLAYPPGTGRPFHP